MTRYGPSNEEPEQPAVTVTSHIGITTIRINGALIDAITTLAGATGQALSVPGGKTVIIDISGQISTTRTLPQH